MSRFVLGLGSVALAAIMAFSTPDMAQARTTNSGVHGHRATAGQRMKHQGRYHRVAKHKKPKRNKQASRRHHNNHRRGVAWTPGVHRSIG